MHHAQPAGAPTARASRGSARTALVAEVTAAIMNALAPGIASTIPAAVDGAAMVNALVVTAATAPISLHGGYACQTLSQLANAQMIALADTTLAAAHMSIPGSMWVSSPGSSSQSLRWSALWWHAALAPSVSSTAGNASRRGRPS